MEFNFDLEDEKQIDPTKFKDRVYSFLLKLLRERFFSIQSKQEIKSFNQRFNFACPYCGDSAKDHHKKRGNLFLDSWVFHCYNCNERKNIFALLKDYGVKHDFNGDEKNFIVSQTQENQKEHARTGGLVQINLEEFLDYDLNKILPTRQQIMTQERLFPVKGTALENYLDKRFQKIDERFAWQPKSKRLFIFNLSSDKEKVLSYQIKTFNNKCPYLTFGLQKIYQEVLHIGIPNELEEAIKKLDTISRIFNILSIDLAKDITIFEGPLDCFLWPNAVATAGIGNSFPIEVETKRFFQDNDIPGSTKALELIATGQSVFLWKKLFEDVPKLKSYKIKDLNDLVIKCRINKIQITRADLLRYFSNDMIDAVWI